MFFYYPITDKRLKNTQPIDILNIYKLSNLILGGMEMFKQVDARGIDELLAINYTKKALDSIKEGRLTTIVDNEKTKVSISDFAKKLDLRVKIKESQGNYYIDIFKGQDISKIPSMDTQYDIRTKKDLIILITKDYIGQNYKELGKVLISEYIYNLPEIYPLPKTIIFLNSGVNLAIKGSNVIDPLINLERKGVEIISCSISLDYFKVKDQLMVGNVGGMYKIVEKLNQAKNTISL